MELDVLSKHHLHFCDSMSRTPALFSWSFLWNEVGARYHCQIPTRCFTMWRARDHRGCSVTDCSLCPCKALSLIPSNTSKQTNQPTLEHNVYGQNSRVVSHTRSFLESPTCSKEAATVYGKSVLKLSSFWELLKVSFSSVPVLFLFLPLTLGGLCEDAWYHKHWRQWGHTEGKNTEKKKNGYILTFGNMFSLNRVLGVQGPWRRWENQSGGLFLVTDHTGLRNWNTAK